MTKSRSLFDRLVPESKLNSAFATVRAFPGNEPTRLAMDAVFHRFDDVDGNFIEQFQTNGFDARTFELFLFAYFADAGFNITRPERPDFLIERDGLTAAVEATTSNPTHLRSTALHSPSNESISPPNATTTGSIIDSEQHELSDRPHPNEVHPAPPTTKELAAHQARAEHELPIKIGSALYSKLQKRYWDLPVVKDRPFVIAVEAFHAEDSLLFSSAGLANYLFGIDQSWEHREDGTLVVTNTSRARHQFGVKEIPSHFFAQPDTEHVSAVLFTNSGTTAKFTRMGYQAGLHRGNLLIGRSGFWPDPDPNSTQPQVRSYTLEDPPYEEWWGEGVVIFHNPNAKHPLPHDFFADATQVYRRGSDILADGSNLSPYLSRTITLVFDDETFTPVNDAASDVGTVLQAEFEQLEPGRTPQASHFTREVAWYTTKSQQLLGVVFEDRQDKDYGWAVLGRDLNGRFRCIVVESSIAEAHKAREDVLSRLVLLVNEGIFVFPQGDENEIDDDAPP